MPQQIRISLICRHYSQYAFCLAYALSEHCEVQLVLRLRNAIDEIGEEYIFRRSHPFNLHVLNDINSVFEVPTASNKLISTVQNFSPDIVHFQEVPDEVQTYAMLRLRLPMVLTVHDPKPHLGQDSRAYKFLGRRRHLWHFLQRKLAAALITHGSILRDETSSMVGPSKKVFSIHHGPLFYNPVRTYPSVSPAVDVIKFLFFGRLKDYKGINVLLEAANRLKNDNVRFQLHVAGKGELSNIVEDAMGFLGDSLIVDNRYLPYEEVCSIFDNANVVLLPYIEATQSGVLATAIGRGRAVIVSDVGSLAEMVRHNETGLVVPPNSVEELYSAMKFFALNPFRAVEMGRAAKDLAENEYSWTNAAAAHLKIYFEMGALCRTSIE